MCLTDSHLADDKQWRVDYRILRERLLAEKVGQHAALTSEPIVARLQGFVGDPSPMRGC